MSKYHLAQIEIAMALDDLVSETIVPFVAKLDEINEWTDTRPGFTWRLEDGTGSVTSKNVFNDPRLIINMSVWDGIEL